MSLTVTQEQIDKAAAGKLRDEEFIEIIRTSLPYAYQQVDYLAAVLEGGLKSVVFRKPRHLPDEQRAQLLRVFASTSMRQALERHFGIAELAFQNCHYIGGATEEGRSNPAWQVFTSIEGQVLAQDPELVDC